MCLNQPSLAEMEDKLPWERIEVDAHGSPTIILSEEISDFAKFMSVVIRKKVGLQLGYFKVS